VTVKYPDVAQFQAGLSLKGAQAAIARATEGNWLTDPQYHDFKAQAARLGIPFAAYEFLESGGSAESQARHTFSVVGKSVPLMLDFEPIMGRGAAITTDDPGGLGQFCGSAWRAVQEWQAPFAAGALPVPVNAPFISKPGLDKAEAFIDHYRSLGGTCHLLYFPRWFWQILGSQSLDRFIKRDMALVSSSYPAGGYSENGPGWEAYGGMHPKVWQWTDRAALNGQHVDMNAFRGSPAELSALFATGSATAVLNPVKGLHATARYTQVDVAWKPAAHARHYQVKAWVGNTREVARETTTEHTGVTLHGLKEGTGYRVTVWAEPGSGETAKVDVKTKGRA
jgi:hypothetical protein